MKARAHITSVVEEMCKRGMKAEGNYVPCALGEPVFRTGNNNYHLCILNLCLKKVYVKDNAASTNAMMDL